MTVIIHPKKYLTFEQLKDRWQCSDDDLRYLVVNEEIKPSIIPSDPPIEVDWDLGFDDALWHLVRIEDERGLYKRLDPGEWGFLQRPLTKGAHDCSFGLVSTVRDPSIPSPPPDFGLHQDKWYQLEENIFLDEVFHFGVVMMSEIERYESINKGKSSEDEKGYQAQIKIEHPQEKPLSTKERTTLLKILVGLAKAKFQLDPTALLSNTLRSNTSGDISRALDLQGIKVDPDTIRRYLREAVINGLDKANSS